MIWEVDEDCDRCAASGPQTRTQRASTSCFTTATAAESVAPCRCRCVSWEEFKVMFYRVRKDKSGWEPRRLFAVVEFMMHNSCRQSDALAVPQLGFCASSGRALRL